MKDTDRIKIRKRLTRNKMQQTDDEKPIVRDDASNRSVSTRLVIVPPATVYSFSSNIEEDDHYLKLANNLQWFSLFFFLFAGIFFMFSASWDYSLVKNEIENDDGVEICSITFLGTNICTLQTIVAFLSGFGYFITGVIDMWIAQLYEKSSIMTEHKQTHHNLARDGDENDNHLPAILLLEPSSNSIRSNSLSDISAHSSMLKPLLSSIITPKIIIPPPPPPTSTRSGCFLFSQEGVVGFFLATAGFLECIGCLLEPEHEMLAAFFFLVSCNLYFLEAGVALFGLVLCRKCFHLSEAESAHLLLRDKFKLVYYLNRSGDVLFFIGSIIDVTTSYFWLYEDYLQLYSWSVFSSVLWTVDAILYTLGAILYERMQMKN